MWLFNLALLGWILGIYIENRSKAGSLSRILAQNLQFWSLWFMLGGFLSFLFF